MASTKPHAEIDARYAVYDPRRRAAADRAQLTFGGPRRRRRRLLGSPDEILVELAAWKGA